MTSSGTIHLIFENLSTREWAISLEPYGDHCKLEPKAIAHATWNLQAGGEVELELALTDDALLVGNASTSISELSPIYDRPCGEEWE